MIISGRSTRAVKSLTPADILGVDYRERPDGAGDVLIRTSAPQELPSSVNGQANSSLFHQSLRRPQRQKRGRAGHAPARAAA